MGLVSVLDDLYDSEINIQISSFWDGGYCVKLGYSGDGFKSESQYIETLDDVAREIIRMAVNLYPASDFGKKYSQQKSI